MSRSRSNDGEAPDDNHRSELDELAAFGAALEQLRRQCQLSYRSLSENAGYSSSVLAKAASGRERPTLDVVRAFVTACEGDLPDWIGRWHTMNAAVDRYQRELQAMVDVPYEIMPRPDSPARFNRRLQLRVCRSGKQVAVTLRANYAPSTASGVFNGTRLANEEFVRRMLTAANAPDDEQAAWLEWRLQLAGPPRQAASPAQTVAPAQRRPRVRSAHILILAAAAIVVGVSSAALVSASSSGPQANTGLDAKIRSHPEFFPSPQMASSTIDHVVDPTAVVSTVGSTPSDERTRASASPMFPPPTLATTPDNVRTWNAKIVGCRAQIKLAQAGIREPSPVHEGDIVQIVCRLTRTQPKGWYYTDRRDYLNPAIVRFFGHDEEAIPPCTEVPFPENGIAPIP